MAIIMAPPCSGKTTFIKENKGIWNGWELMDGDKLLTRSFSIIRRNRWLRRIETEGKAIGFCGMIDPPPNGAVCVMPPVEVHLTFIKKRARKAELGLLDAPRARFHTPKILLGKRRVFKEFANKYDLRIFSNFNEALDYLIKEDKR